MFAALNAGYPVLAISHAQQHHIKFCVVQLVKEADVKGHSQLMHMRIRYHILDDVHITRNACETESVRRILCNI